MTSKWLQEADRIINGERREAYGPVRESFERIASAWTGVLMHKLTKPVTAEEVALCMIGMKVCREANAHKDDNGIDIAGYVACLEKLYDDRLQGSD